MKLKFAACTMLGILVALAFLMEADTNKNRAIAMDVEAGVVNVHKWYWGECNIPAGSVCATCNPGGCIKVGNKIIGDGTGTAGCLANLGVARGTSCPGWSGWCLWQTAFCGEATHGDCVYGGPHPGWAGACVAQGVGCGGCNPNVNPVPPGPVPPDVVIDP